MIKHIYKQVIEKVYKPAGKQPKQIMLSKEMSKGCKAMGSQMSKNPRPQFLASSALSALKIRVDAKRALMLTLIIFGSTKGRSD